MAPAGWGRERWLVGGIQSPLSLTTRSGAGAILDPQGCILGLCGMFMCIQLPVCACALGVRDKHSCHSQAHHLVFGDSLLLAWSSSSRLGWQASPREPPVSPPQQWDHTCVPSHLACVFQIFTLNYVCVVSKSLCT